MTAGTFGTGAPWCFGGSRHDHPYALRLHPEIRGEPFRGRLAGHDDAREQRHEASLSFAQRESVLLGVARLQRRRMVNQSDRAARSKLVGEIRGTRAAQVRR